MATGTPNVIDHGTTKTGRWLRPRRTRIALWIAVAEGILVIFIHSVGRVTVIVAGVLCVLLYVLWGRRTSSDTARQVTWIAAASQALAVLFVLLAKIVGIFFIAFVVLAAAVAVAFLLADRR